MNSVRRALRALGAFMAATVLTVAALVAVPSAAHAAPGEFTGVNQPTVTGTGFIGSTFEASLDTTGTSPTPQTITYNWYRVDNGEHLSTGPWLIADSSLLGTGVYVLATLNAPGTASYTTTNSAFSTTVRLKEFSGVPAPTVVGTGVVGSTFSATIDLTNVTPTASSVSYRWYRADNSQFLTSGTTYTPDASLVGTGVYVIAHLSATDTAPYATTNSPFSATVHLKEFSGVSQPTVSGTGVVGSPFTATLDTSGITPTPDVTFTWYRADNGDALGTGATYTPDATLVGTGVYVIATLSATDTSSYTTLNSPFSTTVHLKEFSGVGQPTVSGTGIVGSPFTATLDTSGVTPTPDDVTFTWHRADDGQLLGTGTTYTPDATLVGTGVYVLATLGAADTATYTTTNSPFSATVRLKEFTPGAAPVVSGLHTLDASLIASIDLTGWTPLPTGVTWQWYYANGTAIPGATSATLPMTRDLVGSSVYPQATLTAPDTAPYVVAGPPSGKIAAPTVSLDGPRGALQPGATVLFEAWGLLFNTEYELELHSTPMSLGTVTSSAAGTVSTRITIPAGAPAGAHRIVLLRNGVEVASMPVTVSATATLPATGADAGGASAAAAIGLLALSAGGTLVLLRRRFARAA